VPQCLHILDSLPKRTSKSYPCEKILLKLVLRSISPPINPLLYFSIRTSYGQSPPYKLLLPFLQPKPVFHESNKPQPSTVYLSNTKTTYNIHRKIMPQGYIHELFGIQSKQPTVKRGKERVHPKHYRFRKY
jgi:hypothetical protein